MDAFLGSTTVGSISVRSSAYKFSCERDDSYIYLKANAQGKHDDVCVVVAIHRRDGLPMRRTNDILAGRLQRQA